MNTSRRGFLGTLLAVAASPALASSDAKPVAQNAIVDELAKRGICLDSEEYTIEACIKFADNDTYFSSQLAGQVQPGKYHFFATVNKGDKVIHYIDGVAINRDANIDNVFAELYLISIGASPASMTNNVLVDSLRATAAARDIKPG